MEKENHGWGEIEEVNLTIEKFLSFHVAPFLLDLAWCLGEAIWELIGRVVTGSEGTWIRVELSASTSLTLVWCF